MMVCKPVKEPFASFIRIFDDQVCLPLHIHFHMGFFHLLGIVICENNA